MGASRSRLEPDDKLLAARCRLDRAGHELKVFSWIMKATRGLLVAGLRLKGPGPRRGVGGVKHGAPIRARSAGAEAQVRAPPRPGPLPVYVVVQPLQRARSGWRRNLLRNGSESASGSAGPPRRRTPHVCAAVRSCSSY